MGQQKRTMSCSQVGKEGGRLWGGGFRGSSTCPLAADKGEKCRIIYICISFLRAVIVVLVVSVIILIFCGGHLLFAYVCSTGVFGAIHRCFKHYSMHAYVEEE